MKVSVSNVGEESMFILEAENAGEQSAIQAFVGLLGGRGHDVLRVLDVPTRIESIGYDIEQGDTINSITFASRRQP